MDLFSFLALFGEGLLTGLTLTMMIGPVTMIILKYGIQVNRVAGVWAAAGTWVSDLVFIVITYWLTASMTEWLEKPSVHFWLYVVSGLGLLIMGLLMVKAKKDHLIEGEDDRQANYLSAFLEGFIVNTLSPVTLLFWLSAAVFLHMQPIHPFWYYIGVMLTLAGGDFTKAWLAPKIAAGIKGKYIYWVQIIAGVLIAMSGMYLLGYGYFNSMNLM
jgi:threonine/homoserine/homoserine lactone efflux protein